MSGFGTNFAEVQVVEGTTETDSDDMLSSSTEDGSSLDNGAMLRQGSIAGSRKNSMRPQVKKPNSGNSTEMTAEDAEELASELDRVKTSQESTANLAHLNLGFNVTAIKNALTSGHLHHLRELVLSENNIESLPHNIFDKTPRLVKLDLTDNVLTHIPLSTFTLRHLEVLLLDHNRITSVPATFDVAEPFDMPKLHTIGLEWNKLTEFPVHLFEFAPNISKIFICENLGIKALPPKQKFRASPKTEIRLDNRPEVKRQFEEGGYDDRIVPNWNKIYPDKVIDYVYLGSLRTAQCKEVYDDLDIKFVLTAGRHLDVYLTKEMEQLELPLDDVPGEQIEQFFENAFTFIDKAIAAKKGILLHCFAGLSRSVTVMVAYLMKTRHMSRDESLAVVRQARPNSQPNEGFLQSLGVYESQLRKAHEQMSNSGDVCSYVSYGWERQTRIVWNWERGFTAPFTALWSSTTKRALATIRQGAESEREANKTE